MNQSGTFETSTVSCTVLHCECPRRPFEQMDAAEHIFRAGCGAMPSPSLLDFLLQPELRRQLVGPLTFHQNHQLLGLNKKLHTDCNTVRRTMQILFKSCLDAKLSCLFQLALTRIRPAWGITCFLNTVEQHHICGITAYVCRKHVDERRALRLLAYARQRRTA